MCEICNGMTHEEFLAGTHESIERWGFTMVGVEPNDDHPAWIYTIGLVDLHHHPEMAVMGFSFEAGTRVLDSVARGVMRGDVYLPGETVGFGDEFHLHVEDVDDRLWEGSMFNQWHEYYAWRGDGAPVPQARELVVCSRDTEPDGVISLATYRPRCAAHRHRSRYRPLLA